MSDIQSAAPACPVAAYRPADFAVAYNLSVPTVYRMLADGQLRARRTAGSTLIPREEAERWLASLPAWEPAGLPGRRRKATM